MTNGERNSAIHVAYDEHENELSSAEQELLLAILLSAIEDLKSDGRSGRKAREFFLSKEEDYLFSFRSICDYLHLSSEAMLKAIGLSE
jgi:hypothetical protein